MIMSIAMFFARMGFGQRAAAMASWASIAVLLLMLLGIAKCSYDARVVARHDARIDAKSRHIDAANANAHAAAVTERAADNAAIEIIRKEQANAIRKAPDSAPGAAHIALNCQRLWRAGYRQDQLPAVCRSPR